MVFVKAVTEKNARTAFLGDFYSKINAVSLVLQFFVLPFLLTRVKTKSIFLFIPVFYMILVFGGLGYGAGQIFIIGWVFILMKGMDYSLFSVAKEVMYHPLLSLQKYGAKYLTDMFVYRVAKASIAFVMAQSFIKTYTSDMRVLTIMQFVFLSIWILLIFKLFNEEKKLKIK
jgi:AAA family ATP:ADP antiporter